MLSRLYYSSLIDSAEPTLDPLRPVAAMYDPNGAMCDRR